MSRYWKAILSVDAIGGSLHAMGAPDSVVAGHVGLSVGVLHFVLLLGFVMSCVAVWKLWKSGTKA